MAKKRDYALEYQRRVSRLLAEGLSKPQARGHPRRGEAKVKTLRQKQVKLAKEEGLERTLGIVEQMEKLREQFENQREFDDVDVSPTGALAQWLVLRGSRTSDDWWPVGDS